MHTPIKKETKMNKHLQRSITGIMISVVTVVGAASLTYAVDDSYNTTVAPDETTSTREEKREQLRTSLKERSAERETKQKEQMKAKCEMHKAHLDKLMANVETRSQRVYERITKISELIKKFYVKKELDVTEYDTLIADVDVKRATAKEHLDILLANSGIDCEAESPREMVKEFRDDRKEKIEAMKAYRESVRKLLQAVRQAAIDQLSSRVEAKEDKE
jgi:hypothetical protein